MGKQQYSRPSKGLVDTDTALCGAVHPLYPQLTCMSHGKCMIDSHVGIINHDGVREIVVWGHFFDTPHPWLKPSFRIVPLTEG